MATMSVEGRRVYVRTAYGEPVVAELKALGAKWDPESKRWWLGTAKRAAVEALLVDSGRAQDEAQARGEAPPKERPEDVRLVGRARYKGRDYYVRWVGQTRKGDYSARLITLDASVDFWAPCARPGEACDGSGDVAVVTKTYQPREYRGRTEHTTLASIRRFIERAKENDKAVRDGTAETKRCWECGGSFTEFDARRNGGDWNDSYCGC